MKTETLITTIKNHFADLNYKIEITIEQATSLNQFSHQVIFLEGECSLRLYRLVQKYFGQRVCVLGSLNTIRVVLFHFSPDGHRDITGICKLCGCTNDAACPGGCYWVEQDLCSACCSEIDLQRKRGKVVRPGVMQPAAKRVNGMRRYIDNSKNIGKP